MTDWSLNNFSVTTFQCGLRTILGGRIALNYSTPVPYTLIQPNAITVSVSNLPNHFRLRVKVNYFFFDCDGVTKNAVITIGTRSNSSSGS